MRLFGIHPNGKFGEYVQTPFQADHEEAVLEDWLESNPDGIVEDGKILIIGRQVATNFGGFIDLVGIDRQGYAVVVELKRNRTPRDTLAQALEYASFVARLDTLQLEGILRSYLSDESLNLSEHHRAYFELGPDEARRLQQGPTGCDCRPASNSRDKADRRLSPVQGHQSDMRGIHFLSG